MNPEMRESKLLKLCEIEGFEDQYALFVAAVGDSVYPAICCNPENPAGMRGRNHGFRPHSRPDPVMSTERDICGLTGWTAEKRAQGRCHIGHVNNRAGWHGP